MIELHGWLTIRETYKNEDLTSHDETAAIQDQIREIIHNNTVGLKIQYSNGEPYISTLFCSNHHTAETDEIIEIYTKIAQTACGSYGMIYLWDSDDITNYNNFQIYVFKRGQRYCKTDTDFSPCIPCLEDSDCI